ncbi:plasmid mobilization relaxosome protein MobC [Hyphomicrobium sp. CS1BSMeth3]|uniref:plasmid mobilization protein n=1 Tax=Hyphomicrobium sp. CS1BSMeth3 TaxID=1892844 RepID=UPI000931596A|nr:plasmid mobilization relaxosome protein MobC [Hyphomicrobium sp. CS1BSMeth3]
MPRKPARKAHPRNRRVYVYLTADERLQLAERARAENTTLTNFLRSRFTASQSPHPQPTPRRRLATHAREQLAVSINNLAVEASRIGNNLNQLTRQANSGMVPLGKRELQQILAQLTDIQLRATAYLDAALSQSPGEIQDT